MSSLERTTRSRRFGDWSVDIVDCGALALDGGAMFGSVPRVLWQRWLPPDEAHRIPLAMRLLLLRHTDGSVVLVDTGIGDKFDDDFRERFAITDPAGAGGETSPLDAALARAGCARSDVTHLVLTHMHFDHGGGVSRQGAHGLEPSFPQATHYIQKANLETAEKPNPRERASYLPENVGPLHDVRLERLDGDEEILPGLSVFRSDGHTAGMQGVRLEGGSQVLYYPADLSPTRHHVRVPFTMGYDLCALTILEEKGKIWPRIVEENAAVVFEHDPEVGAATMTFDKGKYRLTGEVVWE